MSCDKESFLVINKKFCLYVTTLLINSNLSTLVFFFIQNFLRDLLKEAKHNNDVSEERLIEYTDVMVSSYF
jgi:hypothetical protein